MNVSFYIFDYECCEEYIRKSGLKAWSAFAPTISFATMQDKFKMHRNLLTMEQIKKNVLKKDMLLFRSVIAFLCLIC